MNKEEMDELTTTELFEKVKTKIEDGPLGYLTIFQEINKYGRGGVDDSNPIWVWGDNITYKKINYDWKDKKQYAQNLYKTQLFNLNKNIINLFLLTKNDNHLRKLPFHDCFINIQLDIEGYKIMGVRIRNPPRIGGMEFIECVIVKGDSLCGIQPIPLYTYKQKNKINKQKNKIKKETLHLYKKIQLFVYNFLDFLNDPEVKIITVERDEKRNKKRVLHGKLPIPTRKFVRITGQLKIYMDKLNSGAIRKIDHKFWVRGHFRTLRSEFWKKKRGIRIWIPPFIKGKGILIKRNYLVKKGDEVNMT